MTYGPHSLVKEGKEGRSGQAGPASAQAEWERGYGVGSWCGPAWPIAGMRRKGKRRRGGRRARPTGWASHRGEGKGGEEGKGDGLGEGWCWAWPTRESTQKEFPFSIFSREL